MGRIIGVALILSLTGCGHVLLRRPHPRLIKNPKTVAVLSGKKPKDLVVLVRRDQPFDAVVHVDGSDQKVSGTLLGCRGDEGVLVVDRGLGAELIPHQAIRALTLYDPAQPRESMAVWSANGATLGAVFGGINAVMDGEPLVMVANLLHLNTSGNAGNVGTLRAFTSVLVGGTILGLGFGAGIGTTIRPYRVDFQRQPRVWQCRP